MEDEDQKSLQRSNISIRSIYNEASKVVPRAESICNQNSLFKMLKAMYPSVSKSKVKDNESLILSVKGIKLESHASASTCINFTDIENHIPKPWYILESSFDVIKVCLLSLEKFNGNSILTELVIASDGSIELFVAGKAVDLSAFLITKKIKFN